MSIEIRVSQRGALRWARQHPWIFASDVIREEGPPGIVIVSDQRGKRLGTALYSPRSEIRLRLLDRRADATIDADWWTARLREALGRRDGIDASAYRVVHGEGDGLPSLVIDRYDRWVTVQLLSAGLESCRADILVAIERVLGPEGILLRNDAPVRRHEGLAEEVVVGAGEVPEEVEVREGSVRYLVPLRTGQKTGAFLDQRSNRMRAAAAMPDGGTGLDCFSYHGSFALHLARRASRVVALDISGGALERGRRNAELNGFANLEWREADAFDALREMDRGRVRFDVVVVDPPAFAKSKASVPKALRGYKDINLHAMRLVRPGGTLVSASCSFHVRWPEFLAMITDAAADSGRRVTMIDHLPQPIDHPEIVTIPETGYLKGVILRVD